VCDLVRVHDRTVFKVDSDAARHSAHGSVTRGVIDVDRPDREFDDAELNVVQLHAQFGIRAVGRRLRVDL